MPKDDFAIVRTALAQGQQAMLELNWTQAEIFPINALDRIEAHEKELEIWIATDVARARGLAYSMISLHRDIRLRGIEENCEEIVRLLDRNEEEK